MSTTVWITGDQCTLRNSALKVADKTRCRVLMIESTARGKQISYHKKKLVLIYSVMRHFAEELRQDGWTVDYYYEHPDFESAVKDHLQKHDPKTVSLMEQSEFGANERLSQLLGERQVQFLPHCNFISTADEFESLHTTPDARVTMERFYRTMRKKTGLLMDDGEPAGGEWNYDKTNRQPPADDFVFSAPPQFPADEITLDVMRMVNKHFADHPGTTDNWMLAVTREDAEKAAKDFLDKRLDEFGPHQDAMLHGQPFLNHSVLSPYINTCLLDPLELCREAEMRYIKKKARLASVEGFIRQVIGWREFVWRVYWRLMPEYKTRNFLDSHFPIPDFFWTADTKMRCMSDALQTTIDHGYAHHIVRLMLLGNFSLIAGLDPLAVNDWFTEMFVDGYDWVMVPNVIGMTLHADGGYVGTKPYAASANYINRMSDYCKQCYFDPKKATGDRACPFNSLYWDFLLRNEKQLRGNHRMAMVMNGLETRSATWKTSIRERVKEMRAQGII